MRATRQRVMTAAVLLMAVLTSATVGGAQEIKWIRAVYWDPQYRTNWASDADSIAVKDGLVAAGYELLDADQLQTWMIARIADKKYSVVVFARDNVPITVVETVSEVCTLRRYLDAGGKIVFYADIPLWDLAHSDGTWDNLQQIAAPFILGFNCQSTIWDSNTQVQITALGSKWGLTQTWASCRPISAGAGVIVLATDAFGNAAAWVRTYVKGDTFRGFVRIWDQIGHPPVADVIRVAEYTGLTLKACAPYPADGTTGVATSGRLQWTKGDGAQAHTIYLGTSPNLTAKDLRASGLTVPYYAYFGLQSGVKYYWRVDETVDRKTVHTGDVWSFTTVFLGAYAPEPADGSVARSPTPVLRWRPGEGAKGHHVYFSSNFADVYTRAVSADAGQGSMTTFEPGALRACTTYYWRVDEVRANGSVEPGTIWSFTTAALVQGQVTRQWWSNIPGTSVTNLTSQAKYPNYPTGTEWIDRFEGPTNWADNYGSHLCGWLIPPESGWYTFWIASDDCSQLWLSTNADPFNVRLIAEVGGWTSSRDFDLAPNQKSPLILLQAGRKYFIQALMKEGGGDDNLAVAWQRPTGVRTVIDGMYVDTLAFGPMQAFSPKPADRAKDTTQNPTLSWSAGEKVQQHEIYLGQDQLAVATATPTSSLFKKRQSGTSFNLGGLEWNRTYYWRVDEINDSDPNSPWIGSIWSFTTADFLVVDDFEGYTGDLGRRINDSWTDRETNGTGADVGYSDPPYAEQIVVHQGRQSMPLAYDNTVEPYYSETTRTFATPQDWTINGVDMLTLYVRGRPDNSGEKVHVVIEDSAGKTHEAVHPDANVLLANTWKEWKIPLSGLVGVNLVKIRKISISIGSRENPTNGGTGTVYIDDIRLLKP